MSPTIWIIERCPLGGENFWVPVEDGLFYMDKGKAWDAYWMRRDAKWKYRIAQYEMVASNRSKNG